MCMRNKASLAGITLNAFHGTRFSFAIHRVAVFSNDPMGSKHPIVEPPTLSNMAHVYILYLSKLLEQPCEQYGVPKYP